MPDHDLAVGCKCGQVQAAAERLSSKTVNRVICYCSDCQAFARHLGRSELLDTWGGSDIVQLPAACLRLIAGHDNIVGMKMSSKPTIRWYAKCCRFPLANMSSSKSPALGVLAASFHEALGQLDDRLGRPIGNIHGQEATVQRPSLGAGIGLTIFLSAVPKVLLWAATGRGKPNPFLDELTGQVRYPVLDRSTG